ncbi:hypothetical protein TIFTF001_027746 [Ficus carica]|uniref:Uncharacterized protein n=1 Tax=Ficus carica TaxID=3494 RepID=A0AA88DPS0_FICCA|nr:hypothetical protein TIFTF001_027746 [Ficus carica]
MGPKHGAQPCFRRPSWKHKIPRRSWKTLVEALGFYDGLPRPSWKQSDSTTVFHLTIVESVIPRPFFINRRLKSRYIPIVAP